MASDPRLIDSAGYGAICALHGILVTCLDTLEILVQQGTSVDIRPFLAVADGVIREIYALPLGAAWTDARLQFLLLAHRYRDLFESLAIPDPEVFRMAVVELSEAQAVATAALQQLAER